MSDEVDDFLAHFGVKGMKWGKTTRSDGKAVQYETAESGKRDSAPSGPDRRGKYGQSNGIKTPAQALADRKAKQDWEKETGHKTSQKKFDYNHKDPVRNDYTRDEILSARKRTAAAKKLALSKFRDGGIGDQPWNVRNYDQTRDATIAKHKTRGEQAIASILLGPAGAYLSSNTFGRIRARSV